MAESGHVSGLGTSSRQGIRPRGPRGVCSRPRESHPRHAKRSRSGMAKCPSCDRGVADEARFCGYCGADTGDSQPGLDAGGRPAVDYWVCPRCHVENEVGGAYCVLCGAGAPLATPVERIATASAGAQPLTGGRSRRRWPIAVAAFLGVALIAVAAVAFIHGVGGSGDGVPSTPADATTGATGTARPTHSHRPRNPHQAVASRPAPQPRRRASALGWRRPSGERSTARGATNRRRSRPLRWAKMPA